MGSVVTGSVVTGYVVSVSAVGTIVSATGAGSVVCYTCSSCSVVAGSDCVVSVPPVIKSNNPILYFFLNFVKSYQL